MFYYKGVKLTKRIPAFRKRFYVSINHLYDVVGITLTRIIVYIKFNNFKISKYVFKGINFMKILFKFQWLCDEIN